MLVLKMLTDHLLTRDVSVKDADLLT